MAESYDDPLVEAESRRSGSRLRGGTSRKRTIVPILLASAGLLIAFFVAFAFSARPSAADFVVRRYAMDKIVRDVRSLNLAPGKLILLSTDSMLVPGRVNIVSNETARNGPIEGRIWARKDKDGKLTVGFVTRDYGHAGICGYVYSDKAGTELYNRNEIAIGLLSTIDSNVAPGWWLAHNDTF